MYTIISKIDKNYFDLQTYIILSAKIKIFLENKFTNKIKCIYIDPPYNTGSAFEHYEDNLEHSIWLNLMKKRLDIMYKLLDPKLGTIWITLDDSEVHYCKILCDEIFGRNNFISDITWNSRKSVSNDAIISLNLNTVPEIFIEKWETDKMQKFFDSYKEELYILRDADRSSSRYEYIKCYEECLEKSQLFSGRIILAVSINTYKEKVLLGAIEVGSDNSIKLCATENKNLDHRTMYAGAEYNFETDIFDKKLSKPIYPKGRTARTLCINCNTFLYIKY